HARVDYDSSAGTDQTSHRCAIRPRAQPRSYEYSRIRKSHGPGARRAGIRKHWRLCLTVQADAMPRYPKSLSQRWPPLATLLVSVFSFLFFLAAWEGTVRVLNIAPFLIPRPARSRALSTWASQQIPRGAAAIFSPRSRPTLQPLPPSRSRACLESCAPSFSPTPPLANAS